MDSPRVMVFGATGYTGRHVVERLCERGVETVAHVRVDRSGRAEWVERFESVGATVDGTPWEADAIANTLRARDVQVAFGLLGTTRARAREDGAGYDRVDVGMSLMILRGLEALGGRRFVYLSSLGVGPSARGAYLRARHAVETAVRDSGIDHVIARPSTISGSDRDGRPLERFAARASGAAFGALATIGIRGPGRKWGPMTGVQLAGALVEFGLREPALNRVVEAAELREHAAS